MLSSLKPKDYNGVGRPFLKECLVHLLEGRSSFVTWQNKSLESGFKGSFGQDLPIFFYKYEVIVLISAENGMKNFQTT